MVLTKRAIQRLREESFMCITEEQERGLLELLGTEPDEGYIYSDQDIAEQLRKYLRDHPTPQEKGALFLAFEPEN